MVLTRRFDISRVQVLVMNPILIPQSVNVVIGENLYELRFRVELEGEVSNPQPMEMDHSYDHEPDQCKEPRGGSEDNGSNFVPPSVTGNQGSQGNPRLGSEKGQGAGQGAGHRPATFVLQLLQGLKVLGAKRSVVGSEEVHLLLPDGGGGCSVLGVEGGGDKDQAAQEVCGVEFSPGNSDLELSHGEVMSSAELRRAMEEIGEEEEEVTKDDDLEAPRMEPPFQMPCRSFHRQGGASVEQGR
jgi:hypothetical protein